MSNEKRRAERIEMLGDLPGAATVAQPITIRELSLSGALVESPTPLYVDSLHQFRLTLGEHALVVRGRIAHCRIDELDQDRVVYAAGVDFVDLTEAASRAIANFLEGVKAERRS